jgi:hypothetical protein
MRRWPGAGHVQEAPDRQLSVRWNQLAVVAIISLASKGIHSQRVEHVVRPLQHLVRYGNSVQESVYECDLS